MESKNFPISPGLERPLAAPSGVRHVLFVIDQICQLGGAERVLLNTIRLLPKDRFRCSLVTFKLEPTLAAELPCPYEVLPLKKTYDLNSLKVAFRLRSLIRRERVDIVHTFFETSDLWAGPIAKFSRNVKLISSRRDMGILRDSKHHIAYRLLGPIFDQVIAVSDEVREYCLRKDNLASRKVMTIYNGLELEKINAFSTAPGLRRSLGIHESAPLIATVANIRRVKGIDVLVEAAGRVLEAIPEATFLIIGRKSEPDYHQELIEQITARGLEGNIKFLGESANVFSLLKACDVFLLPSRSEGFSNALIEAMACGLPSVATLVGGNAEAIEDGKNGYLIKSGDAELAAKRVVSLLADRELRSRMAAAARTTVEKKFTAQVMIEKLVDCYDRLLLGAKG